MRFQTSQQMKLGQHMKLAPRMIQSMEILQMPLAELRERIEQELESNPTIELTEIEPIQGDRNDDVDGVPTSDQELSIDPESASDFARLDDYTNANPDAAENTYSDSKMTRDYEDLPRTRTSSGERDAKIDAMASAPARAASLTDQLLDQWSLSEVEDRLRILGEVIIQNLDDDGYLRTSYEELGDRATQSVKALEPTEADWELALQAVQLLLEPAGVGARDARECLLIQIDMLADRMGEDRDDEITVTTESLEVARRLVAEFFEELMKNKLPKVAAKSGYDLSKINIGIDVLRRLSLSPARRLVSEAPSTVIPDGIVEYDEEEDRYFAYLSDGRLPDVQINMEYAKMSADKSVPTKDRTFLKKNLSNAQWLIDAVGQRQHTLLRVINAVVDEQRDYFDYGPEALKPLPMKTISDRLGIHVATVSRAVSEKYIMTPRGVVPLRGFFSGGLATESGEDVSANSVKASIADLIEGEDKSKPFSDEAIVKQLKERGIEIARRTVAKYRDQLGLPTARMRKQF
ncbi:MAG: RNA polymerase factor sigma-54 [Phycisphaerales bacterium]|nr:RNA polymerase factor sigma-54 [Phycisphaerales bacterium]